MLGRARRVLAFCHVNPDGDALGSMLGLGWLLRALRPEGAGEAYLTALVCTDPVPAKLAFLPGADQITTTPPPGPWDAVVALDSSDAKRVGASFHIDEFSPAPVIVLDHHITNLALRDAQLREHAAASTSEIVVGLADALGATIGQEAALCLLTGVVTDTLGFRTNNVTPGILAIAARLMDAGADLHRITELTLGNRPLSIMRLWGLALSQLRLEEGVLWTEVTREIRDRAGVLDEDDGGLVSHLIMAHEARIAAVFGELNDGTIDVDLRASLPYEVASAALRLDGGGHPQASGCHLSGPLADAEKRVLPLLYDAAR